MRPNLLNKIFSLLLLFGAIVSSCTKYEYDTIVINDNAMSFTAGVPLDSKATLVTNDNIASSFTDFGVYAYTLSGDDVYSADYSSPLMEDQLLERSGSSWTYSPTKYWSNSGDYVLFYAYAPYQSTSKGVSSVMSDEGVLTVSYQMPVSVTSQPDITVASVKSQSKSDGVVSLVFGHKLSAISFALNGNPYMKVTSIVIRNIYDSGDFKINAENVSSWANLKVSDNEYSVGIIDNAVASDTVENAFITSSDGYLMALPQSIPTDAEIEFTIQNIYDASQTITRSFSLYSDTPWEENYQYTYALLVSTDDIVFDAFNVIVEPWGDAVTYPYDENGNYITSADGYINLDDYNTDTDALINDIEIKYALGVRDFIVSGDYFEGCMGGYTTNDSPLQILGSVVVTTYYSYSLSPFLEYAPKIESLDLSRVNYLQLPAYCFSGDYYSDQSVLDSSQENIQDAEGSIASASQIAGLEQAVVSDLYISFLEKIVLPNYVYEIGEGAFAGCDVLEDINLDKIKIVGSYAFYECMALKNVDISDAVYIGSMAFGYCTCLETLSAGKAVEYYSDMITGCSSLNTLELTAEGNHTVYTYTLNAIMAQSQDDFTLSRSSGYAIDASVALDFSYSTYCNLILNNDKNNNFGAATVTPVAFGLSWGDVLWKSINFKSGVTSLDGDIDLDYFALQEDLITEIQARISQGIYDFTFTGSYTLLSGWLTSEFLESNPLITSLDFSAVTNLSFEGLGVEDSNTALTSLVLPDYITYVGEFYFSNLYALTSLYLPGVSELTANGFANCEALSYLYLSSSSLTIDGFAFAGFDASNTHLTLNINQLDNVTGSNGWNGKTWLSISFVDDDNNPVELITNGYIDLGVYNTIEKLNNTIAARAYMGVTDYVVFGEYFAWPESSTIRDTDVAGEMTTYSASYNASALSRSSYISSSYTSSSPFMVYGGNITSIDLSGVTNFELISNAFIYSTSIEGVYSLLEKVVLPSDLTYIPSDAFFGCVSLSSVNLENITYIEDYAFYGCSSLKEVAINNCESLNNYSFANCEALQSLEAGNLTELTSTAFAGCTALTSLKLNKRGDIYGFNGFDDFSTESCTLTLNYDKDVEFTYCRYPAATSNVWNSYTFSEIKFEGSYEKVGYINLDDYPNANMLAIDIYQKAKYEGVNSFCVSGTYFYGCFGSSLSVADKGFSGDSPFSMYAGGMVRLDISGVKGITTLPPGAFMFHDSGEYSYFSGADPLEEIVLPDYISALPEFALAGRRGVRKITNIEHVAILGDYAFQCMNSLRELDLSGIQNVGDIGSEVFSNFTSEGCSLYLNSLITESVSLPNTWFELTWKDISFK
ncbi:MAG: leucine-rich repeat protein [Rikenellaceae bacterium]